MASFRGLYDKLVSLVLDTSRDDGYNPVSTDYVAVFDSDGPRTITDDSTWMPKKYVPVTTIGTGGGGGGGGITSFDVTGENGVQLSIDGGLYSNSVTVDQSGMTLIIDVQSVPTGLNWTGPFSNSTNYSTNDVVSFQNGSVYETYWATTAISQGNGNPNNNSDWVLLGTQGPQGATGPTGPAGAAATQNFRTVTNVSATVLANNNGPNGNNATTNNDRGGFIYMENGTVTTTVTIPWNLSTDATIGFPLNYQTSVIKAGSGGSVQIVGETIGSNTVTIRSADGASYLRTQFSSCTLVRKAQNEWVMFGDLTNIA